MAVGDEADQPIHILRFASKWVRIEGDEDCGAVARCDFRQVSKGNVFRPAIASILMHDQYNGIIRGCNQLSFNNWGYFGSTGVFGMDLSRLHF